MRVQGDCLVEGSFDNYVARKEDLSVFRFYLVLCSSPFTSSSRFVTESFFPILCDTRD